MIRTKQIAAAVLMALFLLIQVVKVLHHHEGEFTKKQISQAGKSLIKSPECAVCDYHFVKDADNVLASHTQQRPIAGLPVDTGYLSKRLTSVGLSCADRGPPPVA